MNDVRIIEPAFEPPPPLPPAIRKGPRGRREQLIDGKWVPMEPTPRQREVWDAVQEHGGQTAAARVLGVQQGAVRQSLLGYMAAMGIKGPVPGGGTPRGPRPKEAAKEAPKPTEPVTVEPVVLTSLPPAEPEPVPPAILEAVLDTTTDTDAAMAIGFMRGVLSVVGAMESTLMDTRAVAVAARKALDLWERTS